jgi:hypothetical protein
MDCYWPSMLSMMLRQSDCDQQFPCDARGLEKLLDLRGTPSEHACFQCRVSGIRIPGKTGKTVYLDYLR